MTMHEMNYRFAVDSIETPTWAKAERYEYCEQMKANEFKPGALAQLLLSILFLH